MNDPTHVVYVDPNPETGVKAALNDAGLAVETVATAADCLDALPVADCVVLEYELPASDGVRLCERVRERRPDLPAVMFTDAGDETLAGEAVAAGVDAYVPKSEGTGTLARRTVDALPAADTPAEDAAETGSRLELLVDQSPLAIVEWNLEFETVSWNPAATELFGYDRHEVIGEDAIELLVVEEERADVRGNLRSIVDTGEQHRAISRNVRRDGSTITCEWVNTPLTDDEGRVVSVLSFAQDVTTDRKRAEALETLQETTNELMRTNDRSAVAEMVMEATQAVVDRPRAGLRFFDSDENHLEMAATAAAVEETADEVAPIGPGDGAIWDTYEAGSPRIIDDASTDVVPYDLDLSVGNGIIHPLGDHGVLTVASPADSPLGSAEIHLVKVLAATAEAALDGAERNRKLERTQTIVEAVGDGIFALDTDGRFVAVNDTLGSMTGYDREDLVGEHVSTVMTAESVDRGRGQIRALVSDEIGSVATYEVTLVTDSDRRIPCEVNTTLLRADDELEGTVGIVRDIGDRKEMERELVAHNRKIENLHGIVSRLEACNREDDIYELAVEAAEGVLNFDICVVDSVRGDYLVTEAVSTGIDIDSDVERTSVNEGIAGRTYRNRETHRIDDLRTHAGGDGISDSYRSLLSVPIGDRGVFQAVSSEPAAFDRHDEELAELLLSHVADALENLAYRDQLREERDRFAALFENVPDAVVSASLEDDGPIVERVNPAFERTFGFDSDEIVDEPLDGYIVPPDENADAAALNRRSRHGEIVEAEAKRRTTDGLRDFMIRIVTMGGDEDDDHTFGVYTDITEQKQRQKRVEILNRVLRHDLRNGMNIIDGCAEMLADAVDEDDAQYADVIQERAAELIGLAEKTRAVERTLELPAGATGPVDVVESVDGAIDSIAAEYPEAEITASLPDSAFASANDLLETAILHVLENAVEHADRDDPTVEIDLEAVESEGSLRLTVADDGPGIPEEERELIQEEQEITQLRHASGLGLWLVNWVVTQSGGRLSFEPNEPRGTVVELRVPAADVSNARLAAESAPTTD